MHRCSPLPHLGHCHQRQRPAFAQLMPGINIKILDIWLLSYFYVFNCTECPGSLLCMSCDSSATVRARWITSTSLHFPILLYLSFSDNCHGLFCLLLHSSKRQLVMEAPPLSLGFHAVSKWFREKHLERSKERNSVWLFLVSNSAPRQQLIQYLYFQAAKTSQQPQFLRILSGSSGSDPGSYQNHNIP